MTAKEARSHPHEETNHPGGRNARQHAELRELFRARIRTKAEAPRYYYAREPWDLFATAFADPHCVGHQCWHVRDANHPLHDPEAAALVGDPVMDVYVAIDAAIGRMLEDVDRETMVLVASCTGMGPNYTGNYVLDEILRRYHGHDEGVVLIEPVVHRDERGFFLETYHAEKYREGGIAQVRQHLEIMTRAAS